MMQKLISVITVVFNGERYIQDCIDSVYMQKNRSEIEHIIIDGGSTDNTIDIIKNNAIKVDYYLTEEDSGIYDAMNKGLTFATGKYVCFLNSDDMYTNDALLIVSSHLSNCKPDVLCGRVLMVNATNLEVNEARKVSSRKLFLDMTLNHPACFFERTLHLKYKYSLEYKIASDYELLTRMRRDGVQFSMVEDFLVKMRDGGISDIHKQVGHQEAKKIRKIYNSRMENAICKLHGFYKKWL